MMQQPYDPFGHAVGQHPPSQTLMQQQLYPQQQLAGISRQQSVDSVFGDAAPDELPLLPEGEAGAAGQALRLEADDGEPAESPVEDSDDDEQDAPPRDESSKRRAKRLGRAAQTNDDAGTDEIAPPKPPPVIIPVGDGSFIPSRFASSLGPLLEAVPAPSFAPAGVSSMMLPFPSTARTSSAPQLATSGGLLSTPAAVPSSNATTALQVGIAAAVLADAGVDVAASSVAQLPASLPASVTKDRIIAAMEALESFTFRAAEGVTAVEAVSPELRAKAIDLRATYDRQQRAAAEKRQRHVAAAVDAAAAVAAAAASAAAVALSSATASASRLPVPVFFASDFLLGETAAGPAGLSSMLAQLLPRSSEASLGAACHLLSLMSSWSAMPVWTAQLVSASSAAAERVSSVEAASSRPAAMRSDLVGDAVLSGRLWRMLASAWSGASSPGDDIRLALMPAAVAVSGSPSHARSAGLAIRVHRSLPAQLLCSPGDPVVSSQPPSLPGAPSPVCFLCGLPDTFPANVVVVAFPSPAPGGSSLVFATITQTEEELAICAAVDSPPFTLPPTARQKKGEAVAALGIAAARRSVTAVALPVASLIAHREAWASAATRRRDVLLRNRARAWLSQAEQTRISLSASRGFAGEAVGAEAAFWAAQLQRDGDDFVVPVPTAARVGKPVARVREVVESAGVALAPRMRSVVVSALRSKLRSLRPTRDGDGDQASSAMDWDATTDGAVSTYGIQGVVLHTPALGADSGTADCERAVARASLERRTRTMSFSPESALLAWRASSALGASPFAATDGADSLIELLALPAMQLSVDQLPSAVVSVVLRLAVERLVFLHVRTHVESAVLVRRAALRAQQKAAAVAYVTAYREWKGRRVRQARARRQRIQNAHSRSAEHFSSGGGGGEGLALAAVAGAVPRFASERSGGRRAAALVAAVAIASTGATAAAGPIDSAAKLPPLEAAPPQNDSAPAARRRLSPPLPAHAHTSRLDVLTNVQEDLASDSGDDAFLSQFGAGSDVVRSELELQLRLSEIADRERRLEFRLYSLCPVPDRFPEPRVRGFWTRVHYAAGSRLTTDGAPPLCAGLPAGVPCGAIRPTALQVACMIAAAVDNSDGNRGSIGADLLLLGSADDADVVRSLETEACSNVGGKTRDVAYPDAVAAASFSVADAGGFEPSAGDNVPPPRRRLWMGGCNCAVAVEIERRAVNPWSDAEKLIFMDKFLQVCEGFARTCGASGHDFEERGGCGINEQISQM